MAEKEIVVDLAELNRIEICCSKEGCSGSLTFDLSGYQGDSNKCPACHQPLISAMIPLADAWRGFLNKAESGTVRFRIKSPM